MTFWETIERGEYVMFFLAVLFVLTVVIWWVRGAALRKQNKRYAMLMDRIRDHLTEGDLENARQLCAGGDNSGTRLLCAGLARVGKPMQEVRDAMTDVSRIEYSRMEEGTIWLRLLAVVAPLSGLGGTLVGIIDRLRDLGEAGAAVDTAMVSAAIAPTIVTTVAGLGVGIFALVAYACLGSRIATSRRKLDQLGIEFTNLLEQPS